MVMSLRKGKDVTISKLACNALPVGERWGFVGVDAEETHAHNQKH